MTESLHQDMFSNGVHAAAVSWRSQKQSAAAQEALWIRLLIGDIVHTTNGDNYWKTISQLFVYNMQVIKYFMVVLSEMMIADILT